MTRRPVPSRRGWSRRGFLRASTAAAGGSVAACTAPVRLRRGQDDLLQVALVGCGGRGTGAAIQALSTAGPVRLVAMADAFQDRLEGSLAAITKQMAERDMADRVDVPPERRFVGFDAYRQAMAEDVDVVLLATPPGFRPIHFEHAVERGLHVFMEKPVAVDAPGVRRILAAGEKAEAQGLKVGVGLQRRHERKYQETVRRIREGAVGELRLLRCYWNGAGVWVRPRQPDWTEMEYQMRNWYYFTWLCGDHIVEQHIHNLDVCNWIMGGPPVQAQGQGGRQVRTGPDTGQIFDHHFVEFTYADGTKMFSQCRHIPGCWNSVSEHVHGTLGTANVGAGRIEAAGGWSFRFRGENPNPYQVEHDVLFAAIRENRPHAEARHGALSTMTAILGRMATYSGKVVTWDEALASELDLAPERYAWDADPPVLPDAEGRYPVPVPGRTQAW